MAAGKTADFGIGQVQARRAWRRTRKMMRKRHQWEVEDLRAAGLNPILSAGGAPSMGSPPGPTGSNFGDLGNQVLKAKQDKALRKNLGSQRGQIDAATKKLQSDVGVNNAQIGSLNAGAAQAQAQTAGIGLQNILTQFKIPGGALDASIAGSAMGQAARKSAIWTPHIGAAAQVLGAAGIGRLLLGGGAKKSTPMKTFPTTTKSKHR